MTTESKQDTRPGVSPILGALVAGAMAVLVLTVVAALVAGMAGLLGALVGGGLTLLTFGLGIGLVSITSRLMPTASLLVALLTYTLQLFVLALAVVGLERSGMAGESVSRGWFAGSVIVVTALWVAGQTVATARQRIPVYDLLAGHNPGGER